MICLWNARILCGIKCKCSSEAEAPASCHKIPLIHLCSIVQYACILYFVYTNSVDHIFHCYIPAAFFCWCGVEITKWAVIISLISFTLNCITTMRSRIWLLHFDRGISSVLVQIPLMRKLTHFLLWVHLKLDPHHTHSFTHRLRLRA